MTRLILRRKLKPVEVKPPPTRAPYSDAQPVFFWPDGRERRVKTIRLTTGELFYYIAAKFSEIPLNGCFRCAGMRYQKKAADVAVPVTPGIRPEAIGAPHSFDADALVEVTYNQMLRMLRHL